MEVKGGRGFCSFGGGIGGGCVVEHQVVGATCCNIMEECGGNMGVDNVLEPLSRVQVASGSVAVQKSNAAC